MIGYLAVLSICLLAFSAAAAPPLKLSGPVPTEVLAGSLEVLLDASRSRAVSELMTAKEFDTVEAIAPNFGYTQARIWLRLSVVNEMADQTDWRIIVPEDHLEEFAVYIARDGKAVETLVELDGSSPFSARPVAYAHLAAPMTLEPGASATILIRYWSAGLNAPDIRIETGDSFAAFVAGRSARNSLFYGATSVLILVGLAAFLHTRRKVFLAYATYTFFIAAYLALADGIALQYVWPNHPEISGVARTYAGLGINMSAAIFARSFLRTRELHPYLDRLLIAFLLICLLLLAATPAADRATVMSILGPLSAVMAILIVLSAFFVARVRFREVRFFLLAWSAALALTGTVAARHMLGWEVPTENQNTALRFWVLVDALLLGLAVGDRYAQERAASLAAMTTALAQTRMNLQLTKRLGALEEAYSLAYSDAHHRSEQFQDTLHDMRQPISALRFKVKTLVSAAHSSEREFEEIEQSFAYLEDLIAGQPTGSLGQALSQREPANGAPDLGDTLRAVRDIFEPDAQQAGVDLRVVATSLCVDVPPLVTMRCLSNLVSNAIKYASPGRVLVGVRRKDDMLRLEVHDTGPGLDKDSFEFARGRKVRLNDESDIPGEGFGFAIVEAQAREHGFALKQLPSHGGGLSVALELPHTRQWGDHPN